MFTGYKNPILPAMEIINSTRQDTDTIFELYAEATSLQKQIGNNHWKSFERSLIEREIDEGRQWKIIIGGQIAAVFAITFDDPDIWKELDKDAAIYLHRIATHPSFRGQSLVQSIVTWACNYARQQHKAYVRLDTGSGNTRLINHYQRCGFTYVRDQHFEPTPDLSEHYWGLTCSLLQIDLKG